MNTQKLRSRRVVIPTIAAVAVIGAGGVVWSSAASDELAGGDRDRAGSAALEAVGGGKVTEAEQDDDGGYEVEVTRPDGTQVDVDLDKDFKVLGEDADDDGDGDGDSDSDEDADDEGRDDDRDADDRALSAEQRAAAEKAALAEVDGTVTDVEAGDDPGEAYEVEVLAADGAEWTVELDADYVVIASRADD